MRVLYPVFFFLLSEIITSVRPQHCGLTLNVLHHSDTMDSVKQSAALCLLRLYKTSPDLVLMGEWTSRVVHLLNDQHMVRTPNTMQHSHSFVEARWTWISFDSEPAEPDLSVSWF